MKLATQVNVFLLFGFVMGLSGNEGARQLQPHNSPRQHVSPPSAGCVGACQPYTDAFAACPDRPCLCTNPTTKVFADCLNCELAAGTVELQTAGVVLTNRMNECLTLGIPLDPQVLQNPRQSITTTISPLPGAASIATNPDQSVLQTSLTPAPTAKTTTTGSGTSATAVTGGQTGRFGKLSIHHFTSIVGLAVMVVLGVGQ